MSCISIKYIYTVFASNLYHAVHEYNDDTFETVSIISQTFCSEIIVSVNHASTLHWIE